MNRIFHWTTTICRPFAFSSPSPETLFQAQNAVAEIEKKTEKKVCYSDYTVKILLIRQIFHQFGYNSLSPPKLDRCLFNHINSPPRCFVSQHLPSEACSTHRYNVPDFSPVRIDEIPKKNTTSFPQIPEVRYPP